MTIGEQILEFLDTEIRNKEHVASDATFIEWKAELAEKLTALVEAYVAEAEKARRA